ncbi:MAG: STAS domain-containing protein [Syntrophobacteraceae bacterium]|nr:STAS domain-containing protein [Syntrophobacteraceae bacterium]
MPSIQIEQSENQALIQLQEPLTSALARELRPRLLEVIAKGATQMVMDLSLVDLVDSGGIGLLIATRNSLAKVGGGMRIVGASSEIQHLFQVMRLDRHFEVEGKPGDGSLS